MIILETIGILLLAILIVGAVGSFIYVCLFKAEQWNMPNAARGVGICALAGVFKVLFVILAETGIEVFNANWLNYPLIVMFAVGMLVMMSGFGEGPK